MAVEEGVVGDAGAVVDGREKEKKTRDRSGRKRTRKGRRKHRRTVTADTNKSPPVLATGGAGGEEEEQTEEPIHNHVHHLPEAATVAVASQGDGMGVANLPAVSRVAPEPHVLDRTRVAEPQGRGGGRGRGRGRGRAGSVGGVGDFRVVKIKEEPRDDDIESGIYTCRSGAPSCV